jgi:hypothetical protein
MARAHSVDGPHPLKMNDVFVWNVPFVRLTRDYYKLYNYAKILENVNLYFENYLAVMADSIGTDGPAQPSIISRFFTFIKQVI